MLAWLSACDKVPVSSVFALCDLTTMIAFGVAAVFFRDLPSERALSLNDSSVRREAVPWVLFMSLAWIHLSLPNLAITWVIVVMPFLINGFGHAAYILYRVARFGIRVGDANMITYARMTNVESAWSKVELSAAEITKIQMLRDSNEENGFNWLIAKLRAEVNVGQQS